MEIAVLASRLLLAAVFTVAGLAKLAGGVEFRKALSAFGVPAGLVRYVSLGIPALELTIGALLLTARWAWLSAATAAGVLIAFSVAIAVNLAKGRQPDCRCFGQIHSTPIGPGTLVRNVALAGCAALILGTGPDRLNVSVLSGMAGISGVPPAAAAFGLAVLVVLAAGMLFLWQLFRQQGRLLLRLDHLEQRLMAGPVPVDPGEAVIQGLEVGVRAPVLETTDVSRVPVGLDTLLRDGRAALLIFSDVDCQPCAKLLPEIKRWQEHYSDAVRIAVISRGAESANREIAERYQLSDVLCQDGGAVSDAYRVHGTPAAVLVHPDGAVGAPTATGREAIAALLATHRERNPLSEVAEAYGTALR